MASLKKHSYGIPPSTSSGIVSDLTRSILTVSLLVVGYQVVANGLVEESEEQRGNSNFLLLGTRKDVIPVEVDTHKKIVLATLATCTPTNNTLSVI